MGMMFKTGIIEWIKFDFHFDKKEEFIYTILTSNKIC